MLTRNLTTIPCDLTVEIVPNLFLSAVGPYDQDDQNPKKSYFVVSNLEALEQARIDLSFSKSPTHFRYYSGYHQRCIDEAFHFPLIVAKETGIPFLLGCNFLYDQYQFNKPGKEVPTTATVRVHAHQLAHMLNFFL